MKLQKIILIFFIACFLNMEVLSTGIQSVISNRADSSEILPGLSNLNNEQDIFDSIPHSDIEETEETELDEYKRVRKNRKVLSPPYLLHFIHCQQSSYAVSCKNNMSVSEFQHDYNSKLQSMILLL